MKDAMLDLETWGKTPGCAIRSIGAALFTWDAVGATFYCNVEKQGQEFLSIDPETEAWWAKQSKEAQDALLDAPISIAQAIGNLYEWMKFHKVERVWCQGATFDVPIIQYAGDALFLDAPWKFYNVRDTRTAYQIFGFSSSDLKREGTHHNALADCLHQIKTLQVGRERFIKDTLENGISGAAIAV